jgi:hypothetical protein
MRPYRKRLSGVASAATLSIKDDPIDIDTFILPTLITVQNKTAGRGDVKIYIERHGFNLYIASGSVSATTNLITFTDLPMLVPNEILVFELSGLTASDVIDVFLIGIDKTKEELDTIGRD